MSSPATFLTSLITGILHLPERTTAARYIHLFLTFVFSGVMHAASDLAQGTSWNETGAMRFFCTQAVGIMFEDSFRLLAGVDLFRLRLQSKQIIMSKILRYIWVVIFLVWSTPVWIYPSMRMNRGEEKDTVVPFSVLRLVGSMVRSIT